MRFTTPNAFIMSTFAVLSLMAPVANAQVGNVATITSPAAGVTVNAFQSIEVTWTVSNNENVNCNIALLEVGSNPNVPPSPGILQSNVPLQNLQSSGPVTIPDQVAANDYFMQLLSLDGNTVFGSSGQFTIL